MDLPLCQGRVAKQRMSCQPIYQSRVSGEGSKHSFILTYSLFIHPLIYGLIHPTSHPPLTHSSIRPSTQQFNQPISQS